MLLSDTWKFETANNIIADQNIDHIDGIPIFLI